MARTKAVDYDQKRELILTTAASMFAAEGYDRSSMSSLAAACGMSKALLYHYYKNKDALLYDVIRGHLEDLCERVEAADAPTAGAEERLMGLCIALLLGYQDADNEHKVQLNALKFLGPEEQESIKALERRLVVVFADAIRGINPRFADADDVLLKPVTMSLFGMLNWHYMWFRPNGPVSREDYAVIVTQIIVAGARSL
ncbi:TetR/AcrR family transcriptional regulator [Pseudovibrio exalbescens]|uniref:TetR/AcrR family transcriptional regulator n=1 Tax=Pseudovibrio exalbescens TaxID=197461 RepID=UPI0023661806|nr:TetR/AcrR family transcriptional regulator [Pseudovibrio exalbescens]MDD7910748.1 TetR/AcrR family transcriptional regulator [Pseudovibrio exalbescens]